MSAANWIVIVGALVLAGVLAWSVVAADDWTAEQAVALAVGVGGLLVTLVSNVLRDRERQQNHQNNLDLLDAERQRNERERESEERRRWIDRSVEGLTDARALITQSDLEEAVDDFKVGVLGGDEQIRNLITDRDKRRESSVRALSLIASGHPSKEVRVLAGKTSEAVNDAVLRHLAILQALRLDLDIDDVRDDAVDKAARRQLALERLTELTDALNTRE